MVKGTSIEAYIIRYGMNSIQFFFCWTANQNCHDTINDVGHGPSILPPQSCQWPLHPVMTIVSQWTIGLCLSAWMPGGSFLLMPVMASNCPFYQSRESVWSISLYYKMSLKAKVKCKVKIFVLSNLCSGEIEWNVLLNPLERQNGQGILVIGAPYVTKYCWFLTLINIECVILNIMVCSKL